MDREFLEEFLALPEAEQDQIYGEMTAEEKAEFDPMLDTSFAEPESASRPGAAALQGFGDTATMGYLPQLQGATDVALDQVAQFVKDNPAIGMAGIPGMAVDKLANFILPGDTPPQNSYVDARDRNIATGNQLGEGNPGATFTGQAAGMGATAIGGIGRGIASGLAKYGGKAMTGLKGLIGQGVATGAAYNPGDVEGEVNPVQAGDRSLNALLGGATGGALGGVGHLANKSKMVGVVKDRVKQAATSKSQLSETGDDLIEKVVKPKLKEVIGVVKDDVIRVNPRVLKDISPALTRVAKKLESKAGPSATRVEIKGPRAVRLRKIMDKRAEYKGEHGQTVVNPKIKQKADIIRDKLNDLDPRVQSLNAEAGEALDLVKVMNKGQKRPISAVTSVNKDRQALMQRADQLTGGNISKTGEAMTSAEKQLIKGGIRDFVHPMEAPVTWLGKITPRTVQGTARMSTANNPLSQDSLIRALLERSRDTGKD